MSFIQVNLNLWNGFQNTLLIFALTLIFSLPLGLLISFGSMSKYRLLRYPINILIWIVRGTPLMLQIMVIFYVPGLIFNAPIASRFNAVIIAFALNYACYFSEIYRGGIQSISKSQYEAGQVLGMTKAQIFFRVILLQVIKRIIPPMSNEIITLVKDTALARIIVVVELLKEAEILATRGMIWPLFFTGVYYLAFVGILTLMFNYAEKRLQYFRA
ncbi:MAG: amino acid ABC transporter permease [Oscillospiraceae bacterium]|nr:amino acid ABC transporter permease [Oscillospiraceae bacterium]